MMKRNAGLQVQVSMSGMLILGTFLKILYNLFRSSIYASLVLERDVHNSQRVELLVCFLHAATCAASFLNVLSHVAVTLGVLNDTYVLSILVGVGFDVLTRVLQLVWWIAITKNFPPATATRTDSTVPLLLVMLVFYIYHMIVHVRALFLNQSLSRLQTTLKAALNNLRGIPGDGYLDHIFAYTDLGTHLFALWLSFVVLRREGAVALAVGFLAILAVLSHRALSKIPFSDSSDKQLASLIKVIDETNGKRIITCSCKACKMKKERIGDDSCVVSFTVNYRDGICQLWLASFEQLSGILILATKP